MEEKDEFEEDFDWEKSTVAFNKEQVMKEVEQQQDDTDLSKFNPFSNSIYFGGISKEVETQNAYDPKNSFFDTLSCDSFEVLENCQTKEKIRQKLEDQRRIDEETFGPISVSTYYEGGEENEGVEFDQPNSIPNKVKLLDLRSDELTHILYLVCVRNFPQIKTVSLVCKQFCILVEGDMFWQKMSSNFWGVVQPKPNQTWKQLFQEIMTTSPYRPCAICMMYPIPGIRYQCLNCVDTNLCEQCESMGIHPLSHLVMKTFHPEKEIDCRLKCTVPMVCKQCNETKPIMYTTSNDISPNATFCKDCSKLHINPDERLWTIKVALEPNQIPKNRLGTNNRGAFCDAQTPGCKRSCTGINWKCVRCYGYDICEPCDNNIKQNVPLQGIRRHSSECGVLKLYHLGLSYDHWGIQGGHLSFQ